MTSTIKTEFGAHASYANPDSRYGMYGSGTIKTADFFKSVGTWYTIPNISITGTNSSRNKRVKVVVSFGLSMKTLTSGGWSCSITMGIKGLFGKDYSPKTSFSNSPSVYTPTFTEIFSYIQEGQEMGTYVIPGFQVAITSATGEVHTIFEDQSFVSQAKVDVYADIYN